MSVRERILMLRLLEKLAKHPAYAAALGVESPLLPASPQTGQNHTHHNR